MFQSTFPTLAYRFQVEIRFLHAEEPNIFHSPSEITSPLPIDGLERISCGPAPSPRLTSEDAVKKLEKWKM